MAVDPRKFLYNFECAKSSTANAQAQSASRNALGGLGNLAGISGSNSVSQGLSNLVTLGNSGDGSLGTFLEGGVNGVYDAVGLGSDNVNNYLNNIDPVAFNNATAGAESLTNRLANGNLTASNAGQYFADFQNASTALNTSGLFGTSTPDSPPVDKIDCRASPYAMDLIDYGVKHKYLFVVEFKFNTPYGTGSATPGSENIVAMLVKQTTRPNIAYEHEEVNMYNARTKVITRSTFEPIEMVMHDDDKNYSMEFLMNYLNATIPSTNLGKDHALYEEDGMNFEQSPIFSDAYERIKIRRQKAEDSFAIAQQEQDNITAQDQYNLEQQKKTRIANIVAAAQRGDISQEAAQTQIDTANEQYNQGSDIISNYDDVYQNAAGQYSTEVANINDIDQNYPQASEGSASIGVLNNTSEYLPTKTILKEIKIFHIYDAGKLMNVYHFNSPKILNAQMDELDMSSSDPNQITLNFGYDNFKVVTSIPLHGVPDNELPSDAPAGMRTYLHDSTYTGADPYVTGGAGGEIGPGVEPPEPYETPDSAAYEIQAPDGTTLTSNDGTNWQDAEGYGVPSGATYTIDGQTSTFNPPSIGGTDNYGVPVDDYGDYINFQNQSFD